MNACLSVMLPFETAAIARSQLRRCTSDRRFLSACSGVLAFRVYTAEPASIPTTLRVCSGPSNARPIRTAVTTTRMIGRVNFMECLTPRNAFLDAQSARARLQRPEADAALAAEVQGKSPG